MTYRRKLWIAIRWQYRWVVLANAIFGVADELGTQARQSAISTLALLISILAFPFVALWTWTFSIAYLAWKGDPNRFKKIEEILNQHAEEREREGER